MPVIPIIMNSNMQERLKNIRIVFIALLVTAALAAAADGLYFSGLEWRIRTTRADAKLSSLEREAETLLARTEEAITETGDPASLFRNTLGSEALKNGITLLVYRDGRAAYWSDNSIAFPVIYEEGFDEHKPVFYSNGWFVPVHHEFPGYELLALIKVYKEYPIVNNVLRSGFHGIFPLPEETSITFDEKESEYQVLGSENEFHFGLIFPDRKPNTAMLILPVLLWLAVIFLLVRLVVLSAGWIDKRTGRGAGMPVAFAILLIIYAVILITGLPPSVESTELFSPFHWSAGRLMPTVGHTLLLGLLILSGIRLIFRNGKFNEPWAGKGVMRFSVPGAVMLAGFVLFLAAEAGFRDLVLNSAINFEAFRILDMTFMSLAGFISVMLLMTVPVILFMRASRMMREWKIAESLAVTGVTALLLPLSYLLIPGCSPWSLVWVMLMVLAVMLWQRRSYSEVSLMVLFSVLTGMYATTLILRYSDQKEDRNMKVMAISLANDNDMVAEGMLIDMWPALKNDTVLGGLVSREKITATDINAIYRYLEDGYFYGYWENYDLNIVICGNDSPLSLAATGSEAENCFEWFGNRVRNEGDTITRTGFYFMHNTAGRAWYFSELYYEISPGVTNGLFIELVSHIEAYLAGYPELLLDGSHQRFPRLRDISYAKYNGGTLVLRSGEYPYDTEIDPGQTEREEYRFTESPDFKHLYYTLGDMTLALSTPRVKALDRVITFAYSFIVILIYVFVLLVIFTRQPRELLKTDTFRRRLQLSFAGVLTVVFIIVITGALMLSTRQFRTNHTRLIREKAESLSIELEHKLSSEESLEDGWQTADYPTLNHLLVKFSNVFFTDINLYSPSGRLLATSRPEVFARKLEGSMIDPVAYGVLTSPGKEEYIGVETIGEMSYLSAYLPFYNEENRLLAYLNIPYFTMQNLLTGETSNLIVTLINFALLFLLLMMWVSVFLSDRITRPLNMIQQAMASVAYGKKNEHISYKSRDEVGELVKQYNRMTDELEESANKLARTEREMAWREMARQIAHEIKNPLTPMKLNVQQLLKSWNDRVPDFDTTIKGFTANQIEYIDNLSNIATAFSYFARLPGANPAEVDVIAQLRTTLTLFAHAGNTVITLDSGKISKAVVMADREHLNSIFFNLIKNAMQAVPTGRSGEIRIGVAATGNSLQITVEDNGSGIPDEMISRIFTPNFTTKSSGMGLGLSIVKRYVESAGGKIWFTTTHDTGTVFTVELPLLYTV
jgi:signal transduction histidine kinase